MKKVKKLLFTAFATCLCILPAIAASAAGGGAAPIVIVADTRRVAGSAVLTWWGNLYNESHMQFTIMTCILIPATGVAFGLLADWLIGGLGIDLTKRDMAEH